MVVTERPKKKKITKSAQKQKEKRKKEKLRKFKKKQNKFIFKHYRDSWLNAEGRSAAEQVGARSQPYYDSIYYPPEQPRVLYKTQLDLINIDKEGDFLTRQDMDPRTINFYGSKLDADTRNSIDGCDKLHASHAEFSSLKGLAQDFDDNKVEYIYCFLHGGTDSWFSKIDSHTDASVLIAQRYEGVLTTASCNGFWFGTPLGYGIIHPTEVLKRIGACCKYRRINDKYPIFDPQKDWNPESRDDGKKETRNLGPYLIKKGCNWPNFDLQSDAENKGFNTYRETKGGIIEVLEINNNVSVGAEGRAVWKVATGHESEADVKEYDTTIEEIMNIADNSVKEMYGTEREVVVIFIHCSPVPEDHKMPIKPKSFKRRLTPTRKEETIKRDIRTDADPYIIESLKRYARLIIKGAITFELFTKHVKNILKRKSADEPLGHIMSTRIFGRPQAHKKSAKLFSDIVEACFAEQLCDDNGVLTTEGEEVYDRADEYEQSKLNYSIRRFSELNSEQKDILQGPLTPLHVYSDDIDGEIEDYYRGRGKRSRLPDPSNSSDLSDSVSEDILVRMGAKKYVPKKLKLKRTIHKKNKKEKRKENKGTGKDKTRKGKRKEKK
jgi:hypothetical protein